jgi:hypothetical protein
VLMDFSSWGRWNTVSARAPKSLQVGAVLPLVLHIGWLRLPVWPRLVEVEAEESLVWRGGVSGLFVARHGFRLTQTGNGTEIHHFEEFSGLLVAIALKLLGINNALYGSVNARLIATVVPGGGQSQSQSAVSPEPFPL